MKIVKAERIACRLPLRQPFETSYGRLTEKAFDLLVLTDQDGTVVLENWWLFSNQIILKKRWLQLEKSLASSYSHC